MLSTMVAMGEIELLNYPNGININAANIKQIVDMPKEGTFSFSHIRHPKGMNLGGCERIIYRYYWERHDFSASESEVYQQLVAQAKALAAKAVTSCNTLRNGLSLENIQIIGEARSQPHEVSTYCPYRALRQGSQLCFGCQDTQHTCRMDC